MDINKLLIEAFIFMITGMIYVFLFILILIFFINISNKIIQYFTLKKVINELNNNLIIKENESANKNQINNKEFNKDNIDNNKQINSDLIINDDLISAILISIKEYKKSNVEK
jgi:Na+-transporting methylmalonyl-CoA/oxaloacetate decarboxylase gamma subunit